MCAWLVDFKSLNEWAMWRMKRKQFTYTMYEYMCHSTRVDVWMQPHRALFRASDIKLVRINKNMYDKLALKIGNIDVIPLCNVN